MRKKSKRANGGQRQTRVGQLEGGNHLGAASSADRLSLSHEECKSRSAEQKLERCRSLTVPGAAPRIALRSIPASPERGAPGTRIEFSEARAEQSAIDGEEYGLSVRQRGRCQRARTEERMIEGRRVGRRRGATAGRAACARFVLSQLAELLNCRIQDAGKCVHAVVEQSQLMHFGQPTWLRSCCAVAVVIQPKGQSCGRTGRRHREIGA